MTTFKRAGWAVLLVLGGVPMPPFRTTAQEPTAPPPLDRHGEPLPHGAVARFGTVRLRHGGHVQGIAFTADGKALASVGQVPERCLCLWQVPSGKEIGRLPLEAAPCNALALSADGKFAAAVSTDETVRVFDFNSAERPAFGKERLRTKRDARDPCYLAFLPNDTLLVGHKTGQVFLWDLDGTEVRRFGEAKEQSEHTFALSPDGKQLAACARGADVAVWDVEKGTVAGTLPGHHKVRSLAWSPDGKMLAVGDETNTIRLWDVAAARTTARLVGAKGPNQLRGVGDAIHSLAFTPDGKTLVSVGDYNDGTVRIWDVETGKERLRFKAGDHDGVLVAVSPDGKTLALTGFNRVIRLFDLTTGKELDGATGGQGSLVSVAVAPTGKQVATGGTDGVVRLWDPATGKEVGSFKAHRQFVACLTYSPDGSRLLTAGAYEPARMWDLATGKEVVSFAGSTQSVLGVRFICLSPDGKKVALASNDTTVQIADAATGKVEKVITKGSIDRLAFSPDGKRLAGGGFDKLIHVWDVATGQEAWSAAAGTSVAAIAYSPDGTLVAAGTYGGEVLVKDAATGREVRRLLLAGGTARTVAFSPDGLLLAAGGDEPAVCVFELATGRRVRRFEGHAGSVWTLAFAPDGRSLVTASFDTTALVWDLTGRKLAARQRAPLTPADLEGLWAKLGDPTDEGGWDAVLLLANAPGQTVPFLCMRDTSPPDEKTLAKWLADLDSDEFDVREKAMRALAAQGKGIEAQLQAARKETKSAEVQRRLDELLSKLDGQRPSDERLRGLRVVAVLELAATPEARELLERLAEKAGSEEVRRQAKGALDRTAKRP